ncbi:MAG: glycoside hydrolase family 127 protein [Sedimentisphaerales bacterium]|nr:glycoside hydrolase family 127 protein [Sedimentisphaerales bacterium]
MKGWSIARLLVLFLLVNRLTFTNPVLAQITGGDQFPGGTGETETSGPGERGILAGSVPLANFSQLVSVPDITAETVVGHLPHLPYRIPGLYRNNAKGPLVRVIWPAPINNDQVSKAGSYTVRGIVPGTKFHPTVAVSVKAAFDTNHIPQRNVEPFPLGQVVLNQYENGHDSPFIKNRDKFIRTLANTDPDSFLYNFRDAFGQKQPESVRPLRGWDSRTTRLRGHASGHYLTAIAQAYAGTTYDEELRANFLQKMNYLIDTLYALSQKSGRPVKEGGQFNADPTAVPPGPGKDEYDSDLSKDGIRTDYWNWGKGFISAYPPDQFIMLEKGATYGGRNNQIWAPYYTLHKIIAGLLDCYEVGGNKRALVIAEGMGLWVFQRLRVVPMETRISMWNRYIAGEYGGMNEVLSRLYKITNDQRFLKCAQLFDNINFFFGNAEHTHGLARNVDTLRGKHANQHIPQITGALETYRSTQDIQYYRVAENFWDICTHCYMYSIGGVAGAKNPNNAECFTAQPNTLFSNGFAKGGQNETCATYNMLKLSRQLFMYDQDGKYMDYYEQALYNHILASVAEDNPGNTYHVPLNPGSRKRFGNANMNGFTCCNGTALESNTKLQDSIYFKSVDNTILYVNLYVPSTLTWTQRNVVVKQSTNYPYGNTIRLTLTGAGKFDIKVRVPKWATKGFFVKINGESQDAAATPGGYLNLSRTWRDGDTIEIKIPFDFHLNQVMDQPNIASIFYGPVLLAAEESSVRSTWRAVTLDVSNISESISGVDSALRFSTNGITLKPFYEVYGRHSVYLNVNPE